MMGVFSCDAKLWKLCCLASCMTRGIYFILWFTHCLPIYLSHFSLILSLPIYLRISQWFMVSSHTISHSIGQQTSCLFISLSLSLSFFLLPCSSTSFLHGSQQILAVSSRFEVFTAIVLHGCLHLDLKAWVVIWIQGCKGKIWVKVCRGT